MTGPMIALLEYRSKLGLQIEDDALHPAPSARGARRGPSRRRGQPNDSVTEGCPLFPQGYWGQTASRTTPRCTRAWRRDQT